MLARRAKNVEKRRKEDLMLGKKKQEKVRASVSVEQFGEFLVIVLRLIVKVVKGLDRTTVQYWIGHERELLAGLKKALIREFEVVDDKLADWSKFYEEVFGLELDLTQVGLPAEREGFGWIVLVAKDLTLNHVFEVCRKRFAGKARRYYDDLDRAVVKNDREPIETYAIRVRDRVEADEEHKGKSANTADSAGIKGVTILEHMLLELWYHWQTSQHIDVSSLTICPGSRYADGRVPNAYWDYDKFIVSFVYPDYQNDDWRVREVVSLP
jgi:hypothetical protein